MITTNDTRIVAIAKLQFERVLEGLWTKGLLFNIFYLNMIKKFTFSHSHNPFFMRFLYSKCNNPVDFYDTHFIMLHFWISCIPSELFASGFRKLKPNRFEISNDFRIILVFYCHDKKIVYWGIILQIKNVSLLLKEILVLLNMSIDIRIAFAYL